MGILKKVDISVEVYVLLNNKKIKKYLGPEIINQDFDLIISDIRMPHQLLN